MTMHKTALLLLVVFAAAVSTTGCATYDRRDAPWDPRGSRSLMDQIPNEDGAAGKRCCGHLRQCQAHQTPRC
jgi:outer membrane protein assembly factor BamE (lipoprotein component of BamABCDE complex)